MAVSDIYLASTEKCMLAIFLCLVGLNNDSVAQVSTDTLHNASRGAAADDPSEFLSRVELFNENLHYEDFTFNQTTLRINARLGKRFTTRVDIPYAYNSGNAAKGYASSGLGDISFRLLGYKFVQAPRSALTASIEFSLNTAVAPWLGTGKNIIIPMLTYSRVLIPRKTTLSLLVMQSNSFSGDTSRSKVNYTKFQPVLIHIWNRKIWSVVAPEFFFDYVGDDVSMNLELRTAFAPVPRINVWLQGGVGFFGDFIARYQWSVEAGCRYFVFRKH